MFEAFMIYMYISAGNLISSLLGLSVGLLIAYGIMAFFLSIGWAESTVREAYNSEINKYITKWSTLLRVKIGLSIIVISSVLSSMYPTHEDIKYIIGGAVAWNAATWISESDEAKRIPTNVLNAMESFLGDIDGEAIKESVDKVSDATANVIDNAGEAVEKVGKAAEKVTESLTEKTNEVIEKVAE